jgi:hypothetical protein
VVSHRGRGRRGVPLTAALVALWALLAAVVPTAAAAQDGTGSSGDDHAELVRAAYDGLLGRSPDPDGLDHWTGELAAGRSPARLLAALADTDEHRRLLVTDAYERYLDRRPDPDGLRWWVDRLADATTALSLRVQLLGSEEYRSRAGGTPGAFVAELYRDVLGREPDAAGEAHWRGRLEAGVPPTHVARQLLRSAEALGRAPLPVAAVRPAPGTVAPTVDVEVDVGAAVDTEAAVVLVAVDGRPLPGRTSPGPGTLRFTADAPPDLPLGALADVAVTVIARSGGEVARVDTGFVHAAPSVISSFTTYMTPGQNRTHNIRLAARLLDGSVIGSGDTFSLNAALGERTLARGFLRDGMISGGEIIDVPGGGVSQMATTFLNAAWFSGIRLDRFRQHTIWFERYPMCREATIVWDLLDVVVTNDTPHPITVRSSSTPGSVTVSFVSHPWHEVSSWIGEPFDVTGPDGAFTVRCGRTVTPFGGEPDGETYRWRYSEGAPG